MLESEPNPSRIAGQARDFQYFHLLRRQVKQEIIRPLIVMTPKSLLRLPAASSMVDQLATGGFYPAIDDLRSRSDRTAINRYLTRSLDSETNN